ALGLADWIPSILVFAIVIYIPVYLYKAMRRVYEQGGFSTTIKFILLIAAYWVGMAAMFVSMAAIAAFAM
ncbi:MAG: hypothetical protein KJN72_10725, partial [Woeseia sp.]|nr:hypothetical protein [Woeseia sp.]